MRTDCDELVKPVPADGHLEARNQQFAGDDAMHATETRLPGTPEAGQLARAFVRSALREWDADGALDVAELLTTELVANVVTHAHTDMTVRACINAGSLRIEVDDDSPVLPEVGHPTAESEHGRGMLLIAALADEWGAQPHLGDSKTVWFELDLA